MRTRTCGCLWVVDESLFHDQHGQKSHSITLEIIWNSSYKNHLQCLDVRGEEVLLSQFLRFFCPPKRQNEEKHWKKLPPEKCLNYSKESETAITHYLGESGNWQRCISKLFSCISFTPTLLVSPLIFPLCFIHKAELVTNTGHNLSKPLHGPFPTKSHCYHH